MKRSSVPMVIGAFALSALLQAAPAGAAGVTAEDILNDAATTKDVVTNGLGPQGQRFSPLEAINRTNVREMVPAWAFSFGGEKQRGQESQPLVRDGVMYVTASYSRLYALDVKTGAKLWEYNARLPEGILPCCDVVNRGAALFGEKVYFATLDAKLVALNAQTGRVVWTKTIDDYRAGFSNTAAPLVVPTKTRGALIVTGVSGGEFGIVGRVEARNAETGDLVWMRPTIEGHMGMLDGKPSTMTGTKNASWPGDMWQQGGGATWLGGTYDPDTHRIFFGTGNPAPWNSHLRPGDNLYTSSRLAIDPETGEINWHFQTTPNDGWDFDGVNELVAFDLRKDGQVVKAAATADRNGFFYVLNRENGRFIAGLPFVRDITWASGLDANGRPVFNPANRPGNPASAAAPAGGGVPKGQSVFAVPSFLGGKNWMPMAYSRETGFFYVPSNEWGMDIWNEPIAYKRGAAYLGAGFTIRPLFDHIGSLKAIDPASGKVVWEYKNKAPLWGGVLTTAGGLVFTGTPEGFLKAFDSRTGEELWSFQTGSGVVGSPITWEQDGEQMVSVVSGWGGAVPLWGGEVAKTVAHLSQGGMVWTFRIPRRVAAR
ncbi:PQQ-dependent methanol/ethanol family dehydrogenase [Paracraurococcus lichenis]|uniref:PQQ-dependent methanol/ethanol family dehydrogenase n=1 Tax=Paracraurococcus lichenis TaxID=3064888 RepID=A0ABT9E0S3_9PROT|nr:PQQ-dependent methanol/ethanol family dehydrogenase [Paracraurococcus sp. LOR1-02]MDO9709729.1 PQQ-dependent methanol/ethanol family dehydrogenase [Paracraurococcus sp. LOR1-02]